MKLFTEIAVFTLLLQKWNLGINKKRSKLNSTAEMKVLKSIQGSTALDKTRNKGSELDSL